MLERKNLDNGSHSDYMIELLCINLIQYHMKWKAILICLPLQQQVSNQNLEDGPETQHCVLFWLHKSSGILENQWQMANWFFDFSTKKGKPNKHSTYFRTVPFNKFSQAYFFPKDFIPSTCFHIAWIWFLPLPHVCMSKICPFANCRA